MTNQIYILISSLKYEPEPDKVQVITRQQLAEIRQAKKDGANYYNLLIQRITRKQYCKERDRITREKLQDQYDAAIMAKYNVSKDYRQNRWFMEQVRPTIY